jgi:hypothetical protein
MGDSMGRSSTQNSGFSIVQVLFATLLLSLVTIATTKFLKSTYRNLSNIENKSAKEGICELVRKKATSIANIYLTFQDASSETLDFRNCVVDFKNLVVAKVIKDRRSVANNT